jgi:hypothetical protein
MNYWNNQPGGLDMSGAHLVDQLLTALLEDGKYKDACTLAGEQIRIPTSQAGAVQSTIRNFAESLMASGIAQRDAQKLNDVLKLVEEASKLNLEARIRNNLNDFERESKRELTNLPRTAAIWNLAAYQSWATAMNQAPQPAGWENASQARDPRAAA